MTQRVTNKHGIVCTVPDELAEDLLATGNYKKATAGRRAKKDDGSTENQTGSGDGGQTAGGDAGAGK